LNQIQAQRPDLIAYDAYGDSALMWIILLANNTDLPNQFVENQIIRVPAKSTVDSILQAGQSS
jgi:Base plate wedge protein 53